MMQKSSRLAATLLSAAALSLVATPAMARPHWGWGGYHHRDRVDAGDIIAGILIIGGIAAIASAASNDKKRNRYERRDRYDRYERDYAREDNRPQWQDSTGVNGAINRCLGEVTRGGAGQNAEIDAVNRDGDGWKVEGRSEAGEFSCIIDRAGRIRNIQIAR
ncbi:MAG: hypothetical protein ACK4YM_03185 [Novosphingobium sp.]